MSGNLPHLEAQDKDGRLADHIGWALPFVCSCMEENIGGIAWAFGRNSLKIPTNGDCGIG